MKGSELKDCTEIITDLDAATTYYTIISILRAICFNLNYACQKSAAISREFWLAFRFWLPLWLKYVEIAGLKIDTQSGLTYFFAVCGRAHFSALETIFGAANRSPPRIEVKLRRKLLFPPFYEPQIPVLCHPNRWKRRKISKERALRHLIKRAKEIGKSFNTNELTCNIITNLY